MEPGNSDVPSALAVRRDALARNFRTWASRRFPSLIDSPNTKRSREYYLQKDLETIPASIPAATQHVALKRVFGAEFYTPAHAERLFQAFEKLGWHSAETSAFQRTSADWVARSRRGSEGGAWINLGAIVRPGSHRLFRDATEVDLPNGFEDAHAELFSISSSLSCIVVTFNAARDVEGRYEHIARASLSTELRRTKRGFSIIDPRSRKRQAIGQARDDFRRNILKWFKTNLPGAFATSGNLELLPTCELLFLDGIRTQEDPPTRNLWIDYLGLDYGGGDWTSSNLPGLRFAHPVSHVDSQKGHAVLSVERRDLRAFDNAVYGGDDDRAYLNMFSMSLPGLICLWAIPTLLQLYRAELNVVRDSKSFTGQSENAASVLTRLRQVTSNSIDISLLAAELPEAIRFPIRDSWDFFLESDNVETISLISALTRRSIELVDQLATSDRAIRDLLLQQGNLMNALEAIETQRTMSRLTIFITALTIAILILTAVMAVPVVFPNSPEQPTKGVELKGQ